MWSCDVTSSRFFGRLRWSIEVLLEGQGWRTISLPMVAVGLCPLSELCLILMSLRLRQLLAVLCYRRSWPC